MLAYGDVPPWSKGTYLVSKPDLVAILGRFLSVFFDVLIKEDETIDGFSGNM